MSWKCTDHHVLVVIKEEKFLPEMFWDSGLLRLVAWVIRNTPTHVETVNIIYYLLEVPANWFVSFQLGFLTL